MSKTIPAVIYLIIILLFWVIGHLLFGDEFWGRISSQLDSSKWWADNALSLLIFTLIGGALVYWVQELRESLLKKQFSGSILEIVGLNENPEMEEIYWKNAQMYQENKFEEWKFVKSTVSNFCRIKTPSRNVALTRWYSVSSSSNGLIYKIDFSKIDSDKDLSEWSSDLEPIGIDVSKYKKEKKN